MQRAGSILFGASSFPVREIAWRGICAFVYGFVAQVVLCMFVSSGVSNTWIFLVYHFLFHFKVFKSL